VNQALGGCWATRFRGGLRRRRLHAGPGRCPIRSAGGWGCKPVTLDGRWP